MKERYSQRPAFEEIELIDDFSLLPRLAIVRRILDELAMRDLHREELLFCGINGDPVRMAGSFGDRQRTYAVDAEEMSEQADEEDRFGALDIDVNPVSYAFTSTQEGTPAIAVFDRSMLVPIVGDAFLNEYRLAPGHTMDEAAVAVFYLSEPPSDPDSED